MSWKPAGIVEHREGQLLRLQTPGNYATDMATGLLAFLKSELEAEMPNDGQLAEFRRKGSEPVAIRLEGLELELVTDGSEVTLTRVGGSKREFEELCALIENEHLCA